VSSSTDLTPLSRGKTADADGGDAGSSSLLGFFCSAFNFMVR
jgi:hypothetical protein